MCRTAGSISHGLDAHDDEAVIEAITAVKGFGRWSAEMFLMFRLNRPDIFPVGDLGIVKGVQVLLGMKGRPSRAHDARARPKRGGRIGRWRPGTCGEFMNCRRRSRKNTGETAGATPARTIAYVGPP